MDIDITGWLSDVTNFFDYVWNYLHSGIYEFVTEIMVFLTKAAMYSYLQMSLWAMDIGLRVVKDIFVDLGLADKVSSAYSMIPEDIRSTLSFFGVPQAITIIAAAIPTRLAMKFIPFIGR
jgi:hypothetical protein